MLKQKIKYVDFDGNEQEELFYFNLSQLELMEMEVGGPHGSFKAWIDRIIETEDRAVLIDQFKKLILQAYGQRSEDGQRFLKLDKNGNSLSAEFAEHAAFETLFLKMANDDGFAVEFIRGALPPNVTLDEAGNAQATTSPIPPRTTGGV